MDDEPPKIQGNLLLFLQLPVPIPCSAEKKREFDEIGERIVEQLSQGKVRRNRWRPGEGSRPDSTPRFAKLLFSSPNGETS